jgi:RHS repeat-associated protein
MSDPAMGEDSWWDLNNLDSAASWHFLVPESGKGIAWRQLTAAESAVIHGSATNNTPTINDADDEDCPTDEEPTFFPTDPSSAATPDIEACPAVEQCPPGHGPPGCATTGMPTWRVSEPFINLWVTDVPLFYTTSNGRIFPFVLRYKQRNVAHSTSIFGVGNSWECSWRQYIETTNNETHLLVAGGGRRTYSPNEGGYFWRGLNYELLQAGEAHEIVHHWMRYRSRCTNVMTQPLIVGTATNYFLTEKSDPYGRTIYFDYSYYTNNGNIILRLAQVRDWDNKTNTLSYSDSRHRQYITSVTDPYGRTATLSYDADGNLVQIVDMQGIANTFTYDGGFMTTMVTPYGTTTFAKDEAVTNNIVYRRSLSVTLPDNRHEFFQYLGSCDTERCGTNVPSSYQNDGYDRTPAGNELPDSESIPDDSGDTSQYMNRRNSFHWNSQQLTNNFDNPGPDDYPKARMRHWLAQGAKVGAQLGMERRPSPDGTTPGHKVWYAYNNGTNGYRAWPSLAAERLADDSVRWTRWQKNDWGRPTNIVATYQSGTSVAIRTNSFLYDTNTLRNLLVARGPDLSGTNLAIKRQYSYTTKNQVDRFTNALNEVTSYSYAANANLTGITYPHGLQLMASLDGSGFVTDLTWKDSNNTALATYAFTWSTGKVATVTDPRNLTVTNYWDNLDRLATRLYPDGSSIQNLYYKLDGSGYSGGTGGTNLLDRTRFKDRLGNWTAFTYNSLRQLVAVTNALGNVTQYDRCACGLLESVTDPLTNGITFDHDLAGRLTAVHYPGTNRVVHVDWDATGQPTNVWDAIGAVTFTFNQQGLWTGASSSHGLLRQTDFDINDLPTNAVFASGLHFTNGFDGLGRLLARVEVNSNSVEHFGYTANLPWLTAYTNQLGSGIVLLSYDPLGRLTNQVFSGVATNRFTYGAAGDLITLTDGKSQTTTWAYDRYGRATTKTNADGNLAWTNAFNTNGWLTAHWTPAKLLTQYAYDAVGNLTNIDYPTNTDVRLAYDAANRPTNMVDAVGTNALAWTPWGALASEDGPWDQDTVTYGQNEALLRQTLSLVQPNASAWTQSYGYDDEWRLTNITAAAGTFTYSWAGAQAAMPVQINLPNGAYVTNVFDALGRLTSTVLKNSSQTTLNSHAYVYDAANERTRQTLKDANYWDYGYDPLGQLTSAKGTESGGTSRWQEQLTYGYDAAGNLVARTNNALIQTFSLPNTLNELGTASRSGTLTVAGMTTPSATSVTVKDNTNPAQGASLYADKTFARTNVSLLDGTNTFTAIASDGSRTDTNAVTVSLPGSVTFQYDGNGNLTSDGRRAFEYDDANQLTAVQVTNAWRSEFKYDGFGRRRVRTEKVWQSSAWVTASETRYVYDHMLVLQERDANNVPTVTYTRGLDLSGGLQQAGGIGGLLARTDFQGTAFYHGDAGGNITALIDGYQNVVARYRYDPFGNLVGLSGSMADANLYRFSSKEWHANSGTYYYGFRLHEPSLQRWLNRDPIEERGGFNMYGFVNNSPAGHVDGMGLDLHPYPPGTFPSIPGPFPYVWGDSWWEQYLIASSYNLSQTLWNLSYWTPYAMLGGMPLVDWTSERIGLTKLMGYPPSEIVAGAAPALASELMLIGKLSPPVGRSALIPATEGTCGLGYALKALKCNGRLAFVYDQATGRLAFGPRHNPLLRRLGISTVNDDVVLGMIEHGVIDPITGSPDAQTKALEAVLHALLD